ncbi:MAG: EAL domain-containing protein [Candidatus Edwardsbacteria bacterium]|jgi:EAL domain-containing protein (putative c-di-GMP-specific phosphodiesterase class I)|nr:EAL domain-containing protein [Candidatus Edwardsbacteria bacterium]
MSQDLRQDYFDLKLETLRLRGQLFDKGTRLPTLPAVLDELRKLAEADGTLGLIVLTVDQPGQIEETYGWEAVDRALAQAGAAVEEALLRLKVAHLAALAGVRSGRFLLGVRVNGGGEQRLAELRQAVAAAAAAPPLVPGVPARDLVTVGAALLRLDNRARFERQVYRAVDRAALEAVRATQGQQNEAHGRLKSLLDGNRLVTLFQPIIELDRCTVFGHEALSRGPDGSGFENAELLFTFAEQTDLVFELERRCRENALQLARGDGRRGTLFINASVRAMAEGQFKPDALAGLVGRAGLDPGDVVFEITERVAVGDWKAFTAIVAALRATGFRVAIDDMGSGYSSLKLLSEVQPDFLKFDVSLISGIDRNLLKLELVRTLVTLARSIGARVIAEGIESHSEFETIRDLGVPLGQGYYLARPEVCPA